MVVWNGLFRKEFRLTRTSFLLGLLLIIFLNLIIYPLTVKSGYAQLFTVLSFSVILVVGHLIYLGSYLLISLNSEAKRLHLWLYSPLSATKLLTAKILNGMLALVISLGLSSIFLLFWLKRIEVYGLMNNVYKIVFMINTHIVATSIYIGIWVLFLWVIHQVLKRIIGKWSLLIIFIFFNVSQWLIEKTIRSEFFQYLTKWSLVEVDSFELFLNRFIIQNIQIDEVGLPHINFGSYLFYLLITVGIFFLSSWLIDNKVEV